MKLSFPNGYMKLPYTNGTLRIDQDVLYICSTRLVTLLLYVIATRCNSVDFRYSRKATLRAYSIYRLKHVYCTLCCRLHARCDIPALWLPYSNLGHNSSSRRIAGLRVALNKTKRKHKSTWYNRRPAEASVGPKQTTTQEITPMRARAHAHARTHAPRGIFLTRVYVKY